MVAEEVYSLFDAYFGELGFVGVEPKFVFFAPVFNDFQGLLGLMFFVA
jgi:hypothetical protein